jgi:predicted membrane GTPase involved in stress response
MILIVDSMPGSMPQLREVLRITESRIIE